VSIPRFDKANDDRRNPSEWDIVTTPSQVVLLEGWCLGATPQSRADLAEPVNTLEREEDPQGCWRGYVNDALTREHLPLYNTVDQWIMLQAPSFDCVFEWRREQEQKLAAILAPAQAKRLMSDEEIRRFIQFYERLTRHCLRELPGRVDHLFTLDKHRRITAYRSPRH
jgi:D-glycerate 3-kinase